MIMSKRTHGTPAPYGRSCEACSRAKCKCILRPEGGSCDRCHRLKKSCQPSETKRGRRAPNRTDASQSFRIDEAVGRTVQLEERFNQLVASLQPAAQPNSSANDYERRPVSPFSASDSITAHSANAQNGGRSIAEPQTLSQYVQCAAKIEPQQAESLLDNFKAHYLKWFPFVYLPDTVTSNQLCLERPMLWLAIMVTCHTSQKEKYRLDDLYRRTISEEMVVNARKSIDLLLSLICFVGWYHSHCLRENGTMRLSLSLLQQMAISLVYDLRRPSSILPTQVLRATLHRCTNGSFEGTSQDAARTNEERRAFLACFCVTSTISTYIPRLDPIRWSGYLNDCLHALEASPECAGDEILVHYIHLQLVLEKTALLRWYEGCMDTGERMQVPVSFYDFTLREKLQAVNDNIPTHLRENEVLRMQHASVELALSDLAMTESSVSSTLLRSSSFRSRKIAFSCMTAVRSWFEVFMSLPETAYLGQSFSLGVQSMRCLGMLFYLSKKLKDAGEDIEFGPDVEPLGLLDCMLDRLQNAITNLGLGEDSHLIRFHQVFRQMRHTWALEYAANVDSTSEVELLNGTSSARNATTTSLDINVAQSARRYEADFADFPELDLFDSEFLLGWPPIS